jgi:hypothetical protein
MVVGTRLYVGGLTAIYLARFKVVTTEVSRTRATDAIMLSDVHRESQGRAGPHGGSLHAAVAVVMFSVVRRGNRGNAGLHAGSLRAEVVVIVFGAVGVKMVASTPTSTSCAPFVEVKMTPGYMPATSALSWSPWA